MPWTRGEASMELELSRVQSWIETTDPELHGRNGDKGMIRQFWDDRATVKGWLLAATLFGGGDFVIQVLRLLGVVK